tara:strand:+ start:44 stop:802 length:759 start_codon:yes stop_codon:yes gene_type:complete
MAEVSIIIPTKDRPDLLRRAVRSVLNQTYEDWELFIINDSDKKLEIDIQDPRVQSCNNKNKPGANGARNTGIKLAKGEFIAFLDDDDAWEQYKLMKQLRIMKSTNAILCYTGKKIVIQKKNKMRLQSSYRSYFLSPIFTLQLYNFIGTTSSIMIRRENNNFLLFDENLHSLQDYDFYLKLAQRGKIVGIPEGLVTYFFDDSLSHVSINKKSLLNSIKTIYLNQRGIYRFSILVGLIFILIQKIYKDIYYKII